RRQPAPLMDQRRICIGPKANSRAVAAVVGLCRVGNPGQRLAHGGHDQMAGQDAAPVILNALFANGCLLWQENKMRRSLPIVLVSAMIALSGGTVLGKECNGVSFPEQTQVQTSPLTLNGLGLRQATMLKINVYVAALYVAQKSMDANTILASNTPKQLVLHFVRDVDSANLKKAWE